jgi:hypothetical protein
MYIQYLYDVWKHDHSNPCQHAYLPSTGDRHLFARYLPHIQRFKMFKICICWCVYIWYIMKYGRCQKHIFKIHVNIPTYLRLATGIFSLPGMFNMHKYYILLFFECTTAPQPHLKHIRLLIYNSVYVHYCLHYPGFSACAVCVLEKTVCEAFLSTMGYSFRHPRDHTAWIKACVAMVLGVLFLPFCLIISQVRNPDSSIYI